MKCKYLGDRDPKHRAEEIIRICDVTGNKKLTKEEVNSLAKISQMQFWYFFFVVHRRLQKRSSHSPFTRSKRLNLVKINLNIMR